MQTKIELSLPPPRVLILAHLDPTKPDKSVSPNLPLPLVVPLSATAISFHPFDAHRQILQKPSNQTSPPPRFHPRRQ